MARPIKNYCDYFSHDKDMRNHRKVKALRNKFGITGYAVWVMILEYLTGADGNEIENSEHEIELISGDFGVSVTEIRDVLNYCIKLEMLFEKNGFIHSESLDERLSPVYEKRKVAKGLSKKQSRINGKYVSNNTELTGVTVTEMPQSKVNKSKVKEIIKEENSDNCFDNPKAAEQTICGEMVKAFKKTHRSYFSIGKMDIPATLKIACYIAEAKGWEERTITKERKQDILNIWDKIIDFTKNHSLYSNFSISDLQKKWSGVTQAMAQSKKPTEEKPKKMVI